jgi:lysyl-tRNA synthetase class 2
VVTGERGLSGTPWIALPAAVAGTVVVGDALTWAPGGRLYRAVDGVTPVHFTRGHTLLLGLLLLVVARGLGLRRAPHPVRIRAALRLGGVVLGLVVLAELAAAVVRRYGAGEPHMTAALGTFMLLGGLVALVVVFSPAPSPPPGTEAERRAMAALVRHPDADSLAPFALRRDKTYMLSPDGLAAVAYRVLAGTAVAAGDPVGARASAGAAIEAFVGHCERAGWRVAVVGAGAEAVALWRSHGLRPIGIGDEAVLEVARFDLATRRMRNVRQAVSRTHNCGVTTWAYLASEMPEQVRAELRAVARAWLGRAGERGFSMNLDDLVDGRRPECLVVVARDRDGRPVGFQRYALCAAGRTLTLDAMPRMRGAPNGVNERLIVDTVGYAREHGVAAVSLNFAAFRRLLEAGPRTPRELLGCLAMRLLDPLVKVEPLYRFNAKFRPAWQPRSVLVGSRLGMGWVLLAVLGMEFALPYDRAHSARDPLRPGPGPATVRGARAEEV